MVERIVRHAEVIRVGTVRCRDQFSRQVIRPGMVWTNDSAIREMPTIFSADGRAPVSAGIVKSANFIIRAPNNHG